MHRDDFGGLARDLRRTGSEMRRRDMLRLSMGVGVLHLLGCDDIAGSDGACALIPEETAGPFPGDGSNGPNVLNQSGVVRRDLRSSFAGLTGTADGVPLSVRLSIVASSDCAPLAGRAVYLWHCDRLGRYSLYSAGVTNQNYLRAVQETDADGQAVFTTIFPACYPGRWPHLHFEVYPSLSAAASGNDEVATSQLAFPQSICDQVYATAGYEASISSLQQVSLATDGVFADGADLETAEISGTIAAGLTASLRVAI